MTDVLAAVIVIAFAIAACVYMLTAFGLTVVRAVLDHDRRNVHADAINGLDSRLVELEEEALLTKDRIAKLQMSMSMGPRRS